MSHEFPVHLPGGIRLHSSNYSPKARIFKRESKVGKIDIEYGNHELLFRLDEAERLALNYLAGAIQRAVPDALAPVKPELIAEGKRWLLSRPK